MKYADLLQRLTWPLAAAALSVAWAETAIASDEGDDAWVRYEKTDDGEPLGLQTAIGRYEGTPRGASRRVVVDLVGAIHVGDAAYYRALNRKFRGYDVVLYELVAPEGTVVPRGGRVGNDSPLGAVQNGMASMLELDHQLQRVDYTRPNFVHADMSPTELLQSMKDRDEGFVQMYFRLLGQSIAEQSRQAAKGESAEVDLIMAMFSNDRARQLKIALASQLSQLESLLGGFGGEDGSTIIEERNRIALEDLQTQIDAGKRKIAVFYGAGHLTDMDERLRRDFGLRQTEKEWITAWDLQE